MTWSRRAMILTTLLLAGFCYFTNAVPVVDYEITEDGIPVFYIRAKRSDAVAFSGATASSGSGGHIPNIPFDAGVIPNIARGDFSNLHFDFEPPNLPPGAQILSRFGEGEGTGIQVSGRAQGPNGAFSSTSAGADSNGNVKYSLKTGKY